MKKLVVLAGVLVLGGCDFQLPGLEKTTTTQTVAVSATTAGQTTSVGVAPRKYRLQQNEQDVRVALYPKSDQMVEKMTMSFDLPVDGLGAGQSKETIVKLLNENFKTLPVPGVEPLQKLADVEGVDVLFELQNDIVVLNVNMLLDKIDAQKLAEQTGQGNEVAAFFSLAAEHATIDQWEASLLEQGAIKE